MSHRERPVLVQVEMGVKKDYKKGKVKSWDFKHWMRKEATARRQ